MVVQRHRHGVRGRRDRIGDLRRLPPAPVEAEVAGDLAVSSGAPGSTASVCRRHRGKRFVTRRRSVPPHREPGCGFRRRPGRPVLQRIGRFSGASSGCGRKRNGSAVWTLASTVGRSGLQTVGSGVRGGQDGQNTGCGFGRAGVNGDDPRMCMRRAQEHGMSEAVEAQVVQIGAAAGDETGVLPPPRGIADDGAVAHGGRFPWFACSGVWAVARDGASRAAALAFS